MESTDPKTPVPARVCKLCGHDPLQPFSVALLICPQCGVFASIEQPPDVQEHYTETFYTEEKGERFGFGLERLIRLFRWLRFHRLMRWGPYRSVLDVGTDRGWFLKFFQETGAEVFGTQMSAPAVRVASRLLGREMFLGELPDARYPEGSMELVCMYNVLEHVREPLVYLREIQRLLKPGGMLAIEVPNSRCLTARLFGAHWLGWDIPNHLHHFDPVNLRVLLERHGFTVLGESHWSLEFGPFHILQSILNGIGFPRNLFYNLLQRTELQKTRSVSTAGKLLQFGLAALLTPPCTVISILLSLGRQGEVFRFYCRKNPVVSTE